MTVQEEAQTRGSMAKVVKKADILISGLVQVKALRVPHLAPVPLSDQRVLF